MGGGPAPYTPPPVVPQPIEDSVAAKKQAAAQVARMGSSLASTDLNEGTASKADAITRKQLGMGDTFSPQPQPTGPVAGSAPRVSPGSAMSAIAGSSVLTG